MAHTETEVSSAGQNSGGLANYAGHVGDDLERVVRHCEVEATIDKRQGGAVSADEANPTVVPTGVDEQGLRGVDPYNPMTRRVRSRPTPFSPRPISTVRRPGRGSSSSTKRSRCTSTHRRLACTPSATYSSNTSVNVYEVVAADFQKIGINAQVKVLGGNLAGYPERP